MRRRLYAVLFALLAPGLPGAPAADAPRMVLVSATPELAQAEFTRSEVRHLFLGYTVTKGGRTLVPLLNDSDDLLYEAFLQKVIFMSNSRYEQQIIGKVFRDGGIRPHKISRAVDLAAALRTQAGSLTYMWESTAREMPDFFILGELWNGRIE